MSCAPVSAPLVPPPLLSHSRDLSAVGASDNTCDHVCKEPVNAGSTGPDPSVRIIFHPPTMPWMLFAYVVARIVPAHR